MQIDISMSAIYPLPHFDFPKKHFNVAAQTVDDFNCLGGILFFHTETEGFTMSLDLEYFYGNEAEQDRLLRT